jgi:hypothetical protein
MSRHPRDLRPGQEQPDQSRDRRYRPGAKHSLMLCRARNRTQGRACRRCRREPHTLSR